MGFVLELLERHEAVALVRVEEARADALAAADRLDTARMELSNLVIARLTITELTAASVGVQEAGGTVAVSGGGPRAGVRGAVRDEVVYARIREIFAQAGRPLRVKQEGKNTTESVRSKLWRLANDGDLIRVEDGLVTLTAR